ncbi:MAG: FAD-binding oxidoreductase [Sphingopyxis sp.]|nr:FAD-binding oxidoreductase [Sphingopyxis sp.]
MDLTSGERRSAWGIGGKRPLSNPLASALEVDVAVIGGGVAGLSSALHLAEGGMSVALVERGRIGDGATGASAGVIAPQLVRTTPAKVLRRLGQDRGRRMLEFIGTSGTTIADLIARHAISCDARMNGFIAPQSGKSAGRNLEKLVQEWKVVRSDLRVLDAEQTRAVTGCAGYDAAIFDPTGGGVDPLLFAIGLQHAATAAGVQVHEDSPVTAVTPAGDGRWAVEANGCRIVARHVVMAANGGNADLVPELRGTVLPLTVCEVATEALPPEMASVLPGGESLTDLESDVFSVRRVAGDRLIVPLPATPDQSAATIAAAVNRRLKRMLIDYRPLEIENIWFGTAWVNVDFLPRVTKVAEGLIAVQACNGRGLAINSAIGREVSRLLGSSSGRPLLDLEPPRRVAGFFMAQHLPRLLMKAALIAKQLRPSKS